MKRRGMVEKRRMIFGGVLENRRLIVQGLNEMEKEVEKRRVTFGLGGCVREPSLDSKGTK